jgi:phosphoribosylformylglycinamidine cyclo-ligase
MLSLLSEVECFNMDLEKVQTFHNTYSLDLREGDLLLGLGSCGVHTDNAPLDLDALGVDEAVLATRIPELGCTIGEELQKPARIYGKSLACLRQRGMHPKAAVLITGSLYQSVPAIMPPGLTARIDTTSFPVPPIFDLIAQRGKLSQHEMYAHFNMGIGMVIVSLRQEVGQIKNVLCCCGERAYIIGSLVKGSVGIELI